MFHCVVLLTRFNVVAWGRLIKLRTNDFSVSFVYVDFTNGGPFNQYVHS